MKKTVLLFIFLIGILLVNAQVKTYEIENQGYFKSPKITKSGTVFTNNHGSSIYLLENKSVISLVDAPGCGNFYQLSPDQIQIGFKFITAEGKQAPALLDLNTKKVTRLHKPVSLCGQVSFSGKGHVAYSIGSQLYVLHNSKTEIYQLGNYANLTPISPNGQHVVYNKENDELFVLDLKTNKEKVITPKGHPAFNPVWSPDGSLIAYSTISSDIFIYNTITETTTFVGHGESVNWSGDSKHLIYTHINRKDLTFYGSDIYKFNLSDHSAINLTKTDQINERGVSVIDQNTIMYHTYEKREIIVSTISGNKVNSTQKIHSIKPWIKIKANDFTLKSSKASCISGSIPFVNQVWDTPYKGTNYNYSSCAPSTAAMALGFYKKVAKWPTYRHNGIKRNYAAYVGNKYTINGYTFNKYSNSAQGGYGYMWGYGSPNSTMKNYIQKHGLNSTQSWNVSYSMVIDQLSSGYPYPICNYLSSSGHLTLAIGYVSGQHTIVFHDPYGNKNNGSWPNYDGTYSYYDWPGYNNGYRSLNGVAWAVTAQGEVTPSNTPELQLPGNNATTVTIPVHLEWSSPVGANAFRIQISKSPAGWNETDGFTSANTPNATVVVNASITTDSYIWSAGEAGSYEAPKSNATYYWSVRSWDSETGTSKYSEVRSFTTEIIKFEKLWVRDDLYGNMPLWFSSENNSERGLAFHGDNLYVVSRNTELSVKILHCSSGNDKGQLNIAGIAGGTYKLNDIETSWDGQILACNLTVNAAGDDFKIYKWIGEASSAQLFLTFNSSSLRLGDSFTVLGNVSQNAVIYAAAANTNKVIRWVITNGIPGTAEIITLQNISNIGTAPEVVPFGVSPSEDFMVNGNAISATQFTANGNYVGEISGGVILGYSNASQMLIIGGSRYYVAFQNNPNSNDPNSQNIRITNITNGVNNATGADVYGVSEKLGSNPNYNCTGDIAIKHSLNPEDIIIYVLSTNNGIAAYRPVALLDSKNQPTGIYTNASKGIAVYPNPVTNLLQIRLNLEANTIAQLRIIGVDGKSYESKTIIVDPNNQEITESVSHLPQGIFLVQVATEETSYTVRFIKN
ncbi:MAG: T9SS type A sorting domain-containing protein [Salinivirgaceae bacterium]|nr:T9SS type A sorting domain-containing protein [Salinivirgaceae bacterium]